MYHSQETKDSGIDQQIPASGFRYLDLDGIHVFDLNYWEEGSSTSFIRNVRMEFWRIL